MGTKSITGDIKVSGSTRKEFFNALRILTPLSLALITRELTNALYSLSLLIKMGK